MARKWKKIKKVGGQINKIRKNPLVNAGLGSVVPGYAQTSAILDQVNAVRKRAKDSGFDVNSMTEDMKSYAIPRMMDSDEVQGAISHYSRARDFYNGYRSDY